MSRLTVWKIQKWLMVLCFQMTTLTRGHVAGTDTIRLLGVMYSLLWGRGEQLYSASLGEFGGSESTWWLWLQLALLRIQIWNLSHGFVQFVSCTDGCKCWNPTRTMREKFFTCAQIWLHSKSSYTAGGDARLHSLHPVAMVTKVTY